MIPGHHRSAGDRPAAARTTPALPATLLRPRHNLDTPEFHGRWLGIAIPLAAVFWTLVIVGGPHLVASLWP